MRAKNKSVNKLKMKINLDKDKRYYWTMHSKYKLAQYNLSPQLIRRTIRNPDRREEGIAPNTIAAMKRKSSKDPKKGEIWTMYQKRFKEKFDLKTRIFSGGRIIIISVWIYPGISPKGKEIFIPEDVWRELKKYY